MRSPRNDSVKVQEVYGHAAGVLQASLGFVDQGRKCSVSTLFSLLFFAASRRTSIDDACQRLRHAPTGQAARRALRANLPSMAELERGLNQALAADLPPGLRKKRRPLVIDLTEIPYYGRQPCREERAVRRGKAKSGTTRFHAYATLYVLRKGRRFTAAMTHVTKEDALTDILRRLLRRARQLGLRPRFLLLDRQFYNVDVIRYLQAARQPFLMPVAYRGRKPKKAPESQTARRFLRWKKSGWSAHTWRNPQGRRATVRICVSCGNYQGRWKRHGRRPFVYAFWGFQPAAPTGVRHLYRRRFGIESSYRQMHQGRGRTCSHCLPLRMLLVGIALVLRNLWVWYHAQVLARRLPGGGLELHLDRLRLRTLLLMLQRFAEALLGAAESVTLNPKTTLNLQLARPGPEKFNY